MRNLCFDSKFKFCNLQVVTLLRVLWRIGKLIRRTTSLSATHLSSCIPVVCDDLGAHVRSSFFPLLLHVLQVLRACSGTCHTSCGSLVRDTSRQGGLFLFLHLLLSKLLGVTLLLKNPIELSIIGVATALHEPTVEASEVVVVGALFEVEIAAVLEVLAELFWRIASQLLNRSLNLFLFDAIVLVIFVFTSEALPREGTLEEIEQDVAN